MPSTIFNAFGGADRLQRRIFEWFAAMTCVILGAASLSGMQFYGADFLHRVMPHPAWAIILFGLGAIRLGALYINGRWRPTYHLRVASSVLSSIVWFEIAIAAMGVGGGPFRLEGSVVFSVMVLGEMLASSIASKEARIADEAARIINSR